MQHLATTVCDCGHEFTTSDIRPPLQRVPNGYFGSSVDRTSDTECPGCGKAYSLLIKQTGQTWRVRSIALKGDQVEQPAVRGETTRDQFDEMEAPELKAWLDASGVEYVKQWGAKKLREAARNWLAAQQTNTEDETE